MDDMLWFVMNVMNVNIIWIVIECMIIDEMD